jgi:hypothetical protein
MLSDSVLLGLATLAGVWLEWMSVELLVDAYHFNRVLHIPLSGQDASPWQCLGRVLCLVPTSFLANHWRLLRNCDAPGVLSLRRTV